MGVVLLCIVISVMLYGFLAYHIWLIYYGYTTNEKMKASQIRYYLNKTENFLTKWLKVKKEHDDFEPAKKSIEYYGVKADWDVKKIQERLDDTKKDLDIIKESPYRVPFMKALRMIAFPDDYIN